MRELRKQIKKTRRCLEDIDNDPPLENVQKGVLGVLDFIEFAVRKLDSARAKGHPIRLDYLGAIINDMMAEANTLAIILEMKPSRQKTRKAFISSLTLFMLAVNDSLPFMLAPWAVDTKIEN